MKWKRQAALRRQCPVTTVGKNDLESFVREFRNVAEAQGGVASLVEKTKLNRESLYRMLSERGNPEFRSLDALLAR